MKCSIGIDIGGSSAKLGLVTARGDVAAEEQALFKSSGRQQVLDELAAAVERLIRRAREQELEIVALGCGVPGYLSLDGMSIDLNNIRSLDGFPVGAWLYDNFHLPVALDNDACMAARADIDLVGAKIADRCLFVTVGTGLGVVLVAEGQVVRIMHGVTGDAAHIIVDPSSKERCLLGCRGCLETVASARAIAAAGERAAAEGTSELLKIRRAELGEIRGSDVSEMAARGDPVARAIINRAGHWLGIGIASWAAIYEPDLVLLAGGVAAAGEEWLQTAERTMREFGNPYLVLKIQIRRAQLGNKAGFIGAGLAGFGKLTTCN